MQVITRDPDNGVVDQSCRDLDPRKVAEELAYCFKHEQTFLGKPIDHWRKLLVGEAQPIADEADPEQYEFWGIKYLEKS